MQRKEEEQKYRDKQYEEVILPPFAFFAHPL